MRKILSIVVLSMIALPAVAAQIPCDMRELAVLKTEIEMYQQRIVNIEQMLPKVAEHQQRVFILKRDHYYNLTHQKQQRVRVLCGESTSGMCSLTNKQ